MRHECLCVVCKYKFLPHLTHPTTVRYVLSYLLICYNVTNRLKNKPTTDNTIGRHISMTINTFRCLIAIMSLVAFSSAHAQEDVSDLRQALDELRSEYEQRISDLEKKLEMAVQSKEHAGSTGTTKSVGGRTIKGNIFNPSIGIVLNGQFKEFSKRTEPELKGFSVGEEAHRGDGGMALDHTELNFSANVDDKFYGSLTYAIAEHEGVVETEVEEAYIETLPGAGAPAKFKFGKALWAIGYLNEQHAHVDDFVGRPLPYEVYFNGAFNDDGIQISKILPTDVYQEVGVGLFRGNDFPFGTTDKQGIGATSLYYRIGGDLGVNGTWRLGAYRLDGETGGRVGTEDLVTFIGDTDITAYDLRYTYAPTGNEASQEITFTAEHFSRSEVGNYTGTGAEAFAQTDINQDTSGYYVAATYKWMPQARVGVRYAAMTSDNIVGGTLDGTVVDGDGFNPTQTDIMFDWTNSEYSRIRLQVGSEEVTRGENDDSFILQYIMSFGAHGAHKY